MQQGLPCVHAMFWPTSGLSQHLGSLHDLREVCFHRCMYGAPRKKHTKFLCNHPAFHALARQFQPFLLCNHGAHPHLPWGHTGAQWATSLEVEYPHALCHTIAQVCHRLLLEVGVVDVPTQMQQDNKLSLTSSSRAVTGSQPRGKKLHPLMRQYSCIIKIRGPKQALEALPEKCSTTVPISLECKVTPPLPCCHLIPSISSPCC